MGFYPTPGIKKADVQEKYRGKREVADIGTQVVGFGFGNDAEVIDADHVGTIQQVQQGNPSCESGVLHPDGAGNPGVEL